MIALRYELTELGRVRGRVWLATHGKRSLFFYNRLSAERFVKTGCKKHAEAEWCTTALPYCEHCGGQSKTRGVTVDQKPDYGACRDEIRRLHEEKSRQIAEKAATTIAQVSKQIFGHALPDPRQMLIPGS